jgi:hypothetical protein
MNRWLRQFRRPSRPEIARRRLESAHKKVSFWRDVAAERLDVVYRLRRERDGCVAELAAMSARARERSEAHALLVREKKALVALAKSKGASENDVLRALGLPTLDDEAGDRPGGAP